MCMVRIEIGSRAKVDVGEMRVTDSNIRRYRENYLYSPTQSVYSDVYHLHYYVHGLDHKDLHDRQLQHPVMETLPLGLDI